MERKSESIKIRVTREQSRRYTRIAKKNGLTVSEFIRRAFEKGEQDGIGASEKSA